MYIEALEARILGRTLERVQSAGPSLLRTADVPIEETQGHAVTALRRIGKRIAIGLDHGVWLVLHLMIAGRLHWSAKAKKPDGRRTLAAFLFDSGCLTLTEAGSRKRASLHVVRGEAALKELDPGGIDVMNAPLDEFARALTSENHTLKRGLTDPRLLSGIGNAYSDEILHRAQDVAGQAHQPIERGRDRAATAGRAGNHGRVDRALARASRRQVSRTRNGISR